MRKVLAGAIIAVVSLFIFSTSNVLAQIDYCEGNFDYDKDVDGGDAALFKSDFGRSQFSNPCPPKGPAPVPKTGQTTVYGSRDDGYWQQAVGVPSPNPRFTDNLDGTVTDNLTGLIWLKEANCLNSISWSNALSLANGLSNGQCGLTDGSIAGDWRLPNIRELFSLVDVQNFGPSLPSGHPFTPGDFSQIYWSSTTSAYHTDEAWLLRTDYGVVFISGKNDGDYYQYIWPVRGGQ